jgi:HSP90 family molecular chaperone
MKIIINSLYSNKEIFLRELISNAVDAMNKVRLEIEDGKYVKSEIDEKLEVVIIPDDDADELTIIDHGIGMDKEELILNLGKIAHRYG